MVAVAVACSVGGLYLSYYASVAAGASVAGTTVVAYLLVLVMSALRRPRPSAASLH